MQHQFVRDVLAPYLRSTGKWKKPGTMRVEAANAKVLERAFADGWLGLPGTGPKRKLIRGADIAEFRDMRKREGVSPITIRREVAVASSACNWAIRELNLDKVFGFEAGMHFEGGLVIKK